MAGGAVGQQSADTLIAGMRAATQENTKLAVAGVENNRESNKVNTWTQTEISKEKAKAANAKLINDFRNTMSNDVKQAGR